MGPDRRGPREDGTAVPSPHAPADPPLSPQDAAQDDRVPDAASLERVALSLAQVPTEDEPGHDDEPPASADVDTSGARADEGSPDEPTDDAAPPVPADDDPPAPADEPSPDAPTDDLRPTAEVTPDDAGPEPDARTEPDADPAPAEAPDGVPPEDHPPAAQPVQGASPGLVTTALADTHHTVEDLNAAERVFLAQQRALVAELCPDPQDPAAVGALFDRVRAQWAQAEDRPDPRGPVEAFGVALGDLLAARLPELSWAVCTDRFGTEMVLARRDPELLVYPVAAVAQAWEDAREGWLVTHLESVVRGVSPMTVSDV